MCYSLSCLKISNTIRNNWKLQLHGGEGSKALTLSIIKHALPRVIARLYMKQVCVRSIEVPTKPCLHCWKACLIVLNTCFLTAIVDTNNVHHLIGDGGNRNFSRWAGNLGSIKWQVTIKGDHNWLIMRPWSQYLPLDLRKTDDIFSNLIKTLYGKSVEWH